MTCQDGFALAQGSHGDLADLLLVRAAHYLRDISQLCAAHPAPRQPQLHRGVGNQISWGQGRHLAISSQQWTADSEPKDSVVAQDTTPENLEEASNMVFCIEFSRDAKLS